MTMPKTNPKTPPFIPSGPPTMSSSQVKGAASKLGNAQQTPTKVGSKGTAPSAVQGAGSPTPGATRFNNTQKSDPNPGSKVTPSAARAGNLTPVKPSRPGTAPAPGTIKRTNTGS